MQSQHTTTVIKQTLKSYPDREISCCTLAAAKSLVNGGRLVALR